jgi:hypothetical protein
VGRASCVAVSRSGGDARVSMRPRPRRPEPLFITPRRFLPREEKGQAGRHRWALNFGPACQWVRIAFHAALEGALHKICIFREAFSTDLPWWVRSWGTYVSEVIRIRLWNKKLRLIPAIFFARKSSRTTLKNKSGVERPVCFRTH